MKDFAVSSFVHFVIPWVRSVASSPCSRLSPSAASVCVSHGPPGPPGICYKTQGLGSGRESSCWRQQAVGPLRTGPARVPLCCGWGSGQTRMHVDQRTARVHGSVMLPHRTILVWSSVKPREDGAGPSRAHRVPRSQAEPCGRPCWQVAVSCLVSGFTLQTLTFICRDVSRRDVSLPESSLVSIYIKCEN